MNRYTGTIAVICGDKIFRVRKRRGFDPILPSLKDIPYSIKIVENADFVIDVDTGKILKQRINIDPYFLRNVEKIPIWEISDLCKNEILHVNDVNVL